MTASDLLPERVTVLERGWLSSNNVVFGSGVTAVVDTGYVVHAQQTVSLVEAALAGSQLALIVNTHLHSDHCGGNSALKARYPGATTVIPPGQADAVRSWDETVLTYSACGQQCARFNLDSLLRPGGQIRLGDSDWEIHAAPGHDPNSVILFEPRTRTLISADALWENGFGIVFPELVGEPGFEEVGATLDLIESLSPRAVIPGHGAVFNGERVVLALARARKRLAAQMADPDRHAAHAMKVLIKFKLLESQSVGLGELLAWCLATPYMHVIHRKFAPSLHFEEWLEILFGDLERSGAIRRDGLTLHNA